MRHLQYCCASFCLCLCLCRDVVQIKTVLKEIAATAAQTVGLKHRERRSFLLAEVKNLLHLARALPGKAATALYRQIGRHPVNFSILS